MDQRSVPKKNPSMKWSPVSEKEVTVVLRTVLAWKAAGRDHIAYFWLKCCNSNTQIFSNGFEQTDRRRSNTGVAN
jgi:hypothetical protein